MALNPAWTQNLLHTRIPAEFSQPAGLGFLICEVLLLLVLLFQLMSTLPALHTTLLLLNPLQSIDFVVYFPYCGTWAPAVLSSWEAAPALGLLKCHASFPTGSGPHLTSHPSHPWLLPLTSWITAFSSVLILPVTASLRQPVPYRSHFAGLR